MTSSCAQKKFESLSTAPLHCPGCRAPVVLAILAIAALCVGILSACAGHKAAVAAPKRDDERRPRATRYDRYSTERFDNMRESGVRFPRPDTKTHFDMERMRSFHVRKLLSTQGVSLEKIAFYFAKHPRLGSGSVYLELHTGDMPYDLKRVVVDGHLDLGDMRDAVEEALKASPFDLTIFIDSDAITFRTHFFDSYGTYLTEDILYLPKDDMSHAQAEDEGLTRIAPYWYYRDYVSVG